ncbi:NEAT domain-containing protein [Lysinibacillus sp. NPDC097195]|uniref:NEAT domain-containing protein n=1 Tax=Lysinibacillus sp. NPDC097195 TaxID=3364141 RepID=UPI00380AA43E
MKKFLQYVAMIVLMLGAILPGFGMDVKAAENTDANCTIDYSASLNVRDETQTKDSVMNNYILKETTMQQQKNGQYKVSLTVPKNFVEWYKGFKVKSGGTLQDAIEKTKDKAGNEIYTFIIDRHDEAIEAWVHVDVPAFNYRDKKYTVYLTFSNVKETKRVCEEAPKKQPETLNQNKNEVISAAETTNASCTIDYSASLNVRDETQTKDSVMNNYILKETTMQQQKNGQYKVSLTVPKSFVEWYKGFKVKSGGTLQDAIEKTKDKAGNEIYTFIIDRHDEAIEAWVHVDVPAFNYRDKKYNVYLTFSNVKETKRVCEEAPKQPETSNQNKDEMKTGKDKGNTNGNESGSGQNNNHSNTAGNNNSNIENAEQSTNGGTKDEGTKNFKQEGVVEFDFPQHAQEIKTFLQTAKTVFEDNKYKVTLSLNTHNKLQEFIVKQNGRELAKWSNKMASIGPVAMKSTASLSFEANSLDNLVFEAVTADKKISANVIATTKDGAPVATLPITSGGTSGFPTQSTNGLYTVDYTFIRGSGSGTSMMDQYVVKPAYVVKEGSSYQVQLTLKNSSWITGFSVNGVTPITISDANDLRVVQFAIPSLAERHNAWVKVDIEDIAYHHNYNIFLQFNEASLSKISDSTTFPITGGPINSGQLPNKGAPNDATKIEGTGGNFVQEGAVTFEFLQNAKDITSFLQRATTVFEDNKYKVTLSLNTGKDLREFLVKQNNKVLAKWSHKAATLVPMANVATLSFEIEKLDNLVFEARTTTRLIVSNVTATKTKADDKMSRQPITYKMEADPNGKIPEFITNYLAPYFKNAELVTIDGKRYIEMTLIGKAYGFETIAYIDAEGKKQNVEIISSKGEKLDQVRIIRLPLVQDQNGVTKIFVDSGSLGYGAYTLFFTFNVPALDEETKIVEEDKHNAINVVRNPFTDIENVFSKDEILALYAAGITTGTTATTFSPNRNITRAQFAVMMARALKLQSNKETIFTDVKGKWYQKEVQALAEVGIVRGVNATTFNPNANITRQQAAAMIMRMLEYKGYKATVAANALSFKDAHKVFDYAKQAISELQAQDIMTGSNGYLYPQSNLTRAQMAKILKRSLQLVNLM